VFWCVVPAGVLGHEFGDPWELRQFCANGIAGHLRIDGRGSIGVGMTQRRSDRIARSNAPQIPFHLFVSTRENKEQGIALAPENQPESQTHPTLEMPFTQRS
jgi:hypothetical protein